MPSLRVSSHRVRNHEVDAQGFMFNSRYLELADIALVELMRHLGWDYQTLIDSGVDPSVVSSNITFKRPARFDDVLELLATCTKVGRSSFEVVVEVNRHDDLLAQLDMVYVNVDIVNEVSRPLPVAIASALRGLAAARETSNERAKVN